MGKNYTLYIKHDEFESELNKSGLVNSLLEHRYKQTTEQPKVTIVKSAKVIHNIKQNKVSKTHCEHGFFADGRSCKHHCTKATQ